MTVSIFGMGYVGVVTAACFARDGIKTIGVDVNDQKIENIKKAIPPIIEPGLTELLKDGLDSGRILATTDLKEAIDNSEVSIISVGTPSRSDGALDLQYVYRVCDDIAAYLNETGKAHTIIIRSTVFPGTTTEIAQRLKTSTSVNIGIAFNPEFLREGTAIHDFDNAPYTVIGSDDEVAIDYVKRLYATVDAPFHIIKSEEAELIKYGANSWHATKIAFANEIGRVAKHLSVDATKVMGILVEDKKLNTSKAYMRPGFAYGGSCLPKDVRAMEYFAKVNNIKLPLIDSLSQSNKAQIDLAVDLTLAQRSDKIGLLGLAFKSGTDDLRESPAVVLAEQLLAKGKKLRILDNAVKESQLIGSNRDYIEKMIPHLSDMIVKDEEELLAESDVIVVTHGAAEFRAISEKASSDKMILDFSGLLKDGVSLENYEGIAW